MRKYSDIEPGTQFGNWTVVEKTSPPNGARFYRCRCQCGAERLIEGNEILRKPRNSCRACTRVPWRKLRLVWNGMRHRCEQPNSRQWKDYGGRGIVVCDEWKSFEAFRDWSTANGYQPGLSIDRIDNDGPYSPDNCRWTTTLVQNNNRRANTRVLAFGETKTLAEWSRDVRCVVTYPCLVQRITRGWELEKAITVPAGQNR
jgi:hypothetical protein